MSQVTTLILLPQTSYKDPGGGQFYTVTGNAQPAAAFYLGTKDLQTVNTKLTDVTGTIVLEATLAADPQDTDWFEVNEFTANFRAPAGSPEKENSNASLFTNVEGNFVFMRARVDYFNHGTIDFIKMSY